MVFKRMPGHSCLPVFLLLCILGILPVPLYGQNLIGIPEILNYTKQAYNAGNQNRDIVQDKNGVMYFANSDGLLVFDGVYWNLYRLPNKTSVRSIAIDDEGRIFAGGQGEIGYFSAGAHGRLVYHPLNPLLAAADNAFADVWNTCVYKGRVFFRTNSKIFEYAGNRIIVYPGAYWSFLGRVGTEIMAYEAGTGLLSLNKGAKMLKLPSAGLPPNSEVRSVISFTPDSLLITTLREGTYLLNKGQLRPFTTPALLQAESKSIYNISKLAGGSIAVATRLGGCYILGPGGQNLVRTITKADGLQSLNILAIKEDKEGNIWLGLDNGIDVIGYRDAIKHIYPEKESRNTGYAAAVFNGRLYLGTSVGLYSIPVNKEQDLSQVRGSFELVRNSAGEVWGLSQVYDQLLLGHATGAYVVDGNQAKAIDRSTGYWNFQAFDHGGLVGGTYVGVHLFRYRDGGFSRPPAGRNFESARFLVQHKGILWAAHPYRGLFKVAVNDREQLTVTAYADKKGVISSNHNKIFYVAGRMVLVNDRGIFEYNDQEQDFVRSGFFTKIFGSLLVSHLYQDRYGNIWFTSEREIGVVTKQSLYSKIIYIGELENRFTFNFENINVIDSNNVIIGAEKGFFHLNLKTYTDSNVPPVMLIRSIKARMNGADSLLYGGYGTGGGPLKIRYGTNGISINYAAVEYRHPYNIEYSYFLEGLDKEWSAWSGKTEKEYSALPPGSYRFYVKCRNGAHGISRPAVYSLIILPPWYQTWWAKLLYLAAGAGLLLLLLTYQQKKHHRQQQARLRQQQLEHEEEQRRLEVEHRLEVQENEKKIVELTNEKLKAELEHKNQELASSAMNLVRKIEVMSKLKEDLEQYKQLSDAEGSRKEFLKIIKVIDHEIEHKQEWERFAIHFDKVHNNYLQSLKEHFPAITANELKLAAYLKLNISTKEIAQLMNISVRGVETARLRLRKKLGLSGEINLVDFLIRFPDRDALDHPKEELP